VARHCTPSLPLIRRFDAGEALTPISADEAGSMIQNLADRLSPAFEHGLAVGGVVPAIESRRR
jgi:hypothetical protein